MTFAVRKACFGNDCDLLFSEITKFLGYVTLLFHVGFKTAY